MSAEAMTIIGLMGTAIAALFGFIVWLFKLVLTRQDERIKTLEGRETAKLTNIESSVSLIAAGMHSIADGIKEMREAMREMRTLFLAKGM